MLNYGLTLGLHGLTDEIGSQVKGDIEVNIQLPENQIRYPAEVELHLYRIVQQACQNALKHSQATSLCISGNLSENQVELQVADNGIGFDVSKGVDINTLLEGKQFGLAGMYERAALIGAQLQIASIPEQGTQVKVAWKGNKVITDLAG